MADFSANIYGTITIGDPETPPVIQIPIDATIPPPTPGVFVFNYEATDIESATKIRIGSFLTWLNTAFNINIPVNDLPQSLQNFTIAILKFHLDTEGNFDIKIEIGTMVDNKWEPEWTPVEGIGITLEGLGFEVTNMPQGTWLEDWINAHAAPAGRISIGSSTSRGHVARPPIPARRRHANSPSGV